MAVEDSAQLPVIVSPESELIATVPLGYSLRSRRLCIRHRHCGRGTLAHCHRRRTETHRSARGSCVHRLGHAGGRAGVEVAVAGKFRRECLLARRLRRDLAQLPAPELSVIVQVSPVPSSSVYEPVGLPVQGEFSVTESVNVTS